MKKKVVIFGLIIIILSIMIILLFPNKEKKMKEEINSYNSNLNNLFKVLQDFPNLTNGSITGNLKYNGAHKEPYSTLVQYEFIKNQENLTINSSKGAISIIWNNELLEIIRKWNKMEKIENILEIENIKDNQITFKKEKLNKIWNNNIDNYTFTFNTKENEFTTNLQGFDISLKENTISIKNNENQYTLTLGDNHYTFTKNDNLKVQLENAENSNFYHIILDNKVFLIEQKEDSIKFSSNNSIENFHSMEITFTQSKTNESNQVASLEDIPILKYLKLLNLPDWSIVE